MNNAVFLDRDGTINVDKGYIYRIEDFEYLEGAVEGLELLQEAGYLLIIVTNQSGMARGYYTEEKYTKLNRWMISDLANRGVHIAGTYYCPHLPQGIVPEYSIQCSCRKPMTDLFEKAARELDIRWKGSCAIGDKERDLCICEKYPVRGILLSDSVWDGHAPEDSSFEYRNENFVVKKSLYDAANYILEAGV